MLVAAAQAGATRLLNEKKAELLAELSGELGFVTGPPVDGVVAVDSVPLLKYLFTELIREGKADLSVGLDSALFNLQ